MAKYRFYFFSFLLFYLFNFLPPSLQTFVLFLCDAHERTVLRTSHALDIFRILEVAHVAVSLTDTIVFRF